VTSTRITPGRLLDAAAPSLAAHLTRLGPLPPLDALTIRSLVSQSGLVGRGGAGFPTGRKLDAVAAGSRCVVVGNGAEGEPASSKDRHLLLNSPHLVLDGLQAAATATGATAAYLYAPADVIREVIDPALRERQDRLAVQAVPSPDAFLSGEESAVVAAIEGRRAVPRATPPRMFERGVGGRPTLVQNVETLAHIGLIARYGPQWFRSVGTVEEPGTRLVTVSGAVGRPGVYEVPGGVTVDYVLAVAGGVTGPVSAVLIGGYHGGWVPYQPENTRLVMTRAALAPFEAAPGAGVVIALSSRLCGLRAGADIAAYLSGQGARQCGPCLNGLPALASTLHDLAYGRAHPRLAAEVERLCALVANRGACHHPAGTVRLARSTLRTFRAEVSLHLNGQCSAGGTVPMRGAQR
jgi:NADH:ubiquinone oxidoreductase subunit F (NADH-binding)